MSKICDCCYNLSEVIQTCNYKHNICSDCIKKYRGKDCMYCNPLEVKSNYAEYINSDFELNYNYHNYNNYQREFTLSDNLIFYSMLFTVMVLTLYLDGLSWILYNYILDIFIYHCNINIMYWYLPTFRQCVYGLIVNSIFVILFLVILFTKDTPLLSLPSIHFLRCFS